MTANVILFTILFTIVFLIFKCLVKLKGSIRRKKTEKQNNEIFVTDYTRIFSESIFQRENVLKYYHSKANKEVQNLKLCCDGVNTAAVSNNNGIKTKSTVISLIPTWHYFDSKKFAIDEKRIHKNNNLNFVIDGEPNEISDASLNSDFVITTKKKFTKKKKIEGFEKTHFVYLPYYVYFLKEAKIDPNILLKQITQTENTIRNKEFCMFAYSNCDEKYGGVLNRKNFYYLFQKKTQDKVTNLGKCYNQNFSATGDFLSNKNILVKFKFVIAFENESIEGYITEKILNPLLSGCVPIYLGASDISKHFNPKRIINVSDFKDFDECIDYVMMVNSNDELYLSIANAPIFTEKQLKKFKNRFSFITGGKFYSKLIEGAIRNSNNKSDKRYKDFIRSFKTNMLTEGKVGVYIFEKDSSKINNWEKWVENKCPRFYDFCNIFSSEIDEDLLFEKIREHGNGEDDISIVLSGFEKINNLSPEEIKERVNMSIFNIKNKNIISSEDENYKNKESDDNKSVFLVLENPKKLQYPKNIFFCNFGDEKLNNN